MTSSSKPKYRATRSPAPRDNVEARAEYGQRCKQHSVAAIVVQQPAGSANKQIEVVAGLLPNEYETSVPAVTIVTTPRQIHRWDRGVRRTKLEIISYQQTNPLSSALSASSAVQIFAVKIVTTPRQIYRWDRGER
ncbi:MAG: hypothetical protein KDA99_01000, partial [Planctomycetales bacterium]|nr:hypothetical protein [Planctomycetales bacterium]